MHPSERSISRYERALRRRRALTSLAAVGIVVTTSACGDDDAAVFGDATIPAAQPTSTTVAPTAVDASAEPTTEPTTEPAIDTAADTTTTGPVATVSESSTSMPSTTAVTATPAPSTTADIAAAAFPAGGELVVDFTFSPSSSGERIRNPYIAVWIEDLDGNFVDTVSLWWHESGRGGTRWLRTLRQWSDVTGEAVDPTSSGATRPAGTYSVGWDGLDADGQPISAGSYRLFVEAAREDGPYEITSADVEFNGATFEVALPDDGELIGVSARLVA